MELFKSKLKTIIFNNLDINSYYNYLNSSWDKKSKHILIACLPKSGSTFLANTLSQVTGYDFVQFQPIRGTNDHNIDKGVLLSSLNKNTVTQLHLKPNDFNFKNLKAYQIKVIFLNRGLVDSLKSFHHHILNENDKWFMFTVAGDFKNWTIERQFDFLIDMVLPWYINFITYWKLRINDGELEVLEIDFDEFKKDNIATIEKILKFYDLSFPREIVKEALNASYENKVKLRVNERKEKSGYELSDEQIARIKKYLSYYPEYEIKL